MRIDIHIIPAPGNEANFQAQLERLKHPLVTTQVAEYVPGAIVQARCRAYAMGTCEYVSWVDDDDTILTLDWLDEAVRILDNDPSVSAVYPRWKYTVHGVVTHVSKAERNPMHLEPHHLTIMRRKYAVPMMESIRDVYPTMCLWQDLMVPIGQLRHGRLVPLNVIAYEWKGRDGSGRSLPIDGPMNQYGQAHIRESLTRFR